MLHFDDKRYLIGNLFEGTSRACLQQRLSIKKVNDVLLTGRTQWENVGGMLGLVLSLADTKKAVTEAKAENEFLKTRKQEERGGRIASNLAPERPQPDEDLLPLKFHGAPNLNYAVATARRFIFRTGMPVQVTEHGANGPGQSALTSSEPTWTDEKLQVWTLPISPESQSSGGRSPVKTNSRKRSFDELDCEGEADGQPVPLARKIVQEMFDSDWRMDRLVRRRLSEIHLPAALFVNDSTGQIVKYSGPMPGNEAYDQDTEVLVRPPWPGAVTELLPRTEPSSVAVSYIVRNYPQRGRFLPQKARELEVFPRERWSQLTKGHSTQNVHGQEVTPEMVMEPGKQGGGFAVIDLPSEHYVSQLFERAEWADEKVMDGIGVFVWILGPGLTHSSRVRAFQDKFSHLKHVISSKDTGEDGFALETAVRSASRHHCVNPTVFPKLKSDSNHLQSCDEHSKDSEALEDTAVQAKPGLTITLEPRIELEGDRVVSPVSETQLERASNEDCQFLINENPKLFVEVRQSDTSDWQQQVPTSDTEIISLGTGSSHPSTHRNVSGTLVRVPGCGSYLFDCGEGSLGSLRRLYTKRELDEVFRDLKMIWISHLHADHHLGTTSMIRAWYQAAHNSQPSLDETVTLNPENPRLAIVSDSAMLHWLREYSSVEDFGYSRILPLATRPTTNASSEFPTATILRCSHALGREGRDDHSTPDYVRYLGLQAFSTVYVNHCHGAQAISVTFNTGLKVSYSGDCRPSADFAAIGRGSHVLIHEATLEDDMRREAKAKKHSTAGEALIVAAKMEAKACVLTHFSQRYPRMPPLGVKTKEPVVKENSLNTAVSALEGALENGQDGKPAADDEQGGTIEDSFAAAPAAVPELQRSGRTHRGDFPAALYSSLIDQGDITRLLETTGIKVVMAFDYMRLPIRLIPILEKQQPLFRALYDKLAEKDLGPVSEAVEDGDVSKQQGKKGKESKKQKQKRNADNRER